MPSDAVTANFPLFTSTSPATSSVLDSVAAPVAFSVPATTVLPVSPATVNLFDEIASDPSDAVTANFPLFTSTSPATSSVLDSVAAPVAFSVPATTVLPVSPATVNLFDEIASDPSDAVTANFPLFTSTSPATSSVLDSVAAPVAFSVPATTVLPVSPATVNLFDEIASDPSDAVTANFPLFTSTSPATSSVLDSVAAPVAFSVPATTVLPVSPATVNLFDEIASDPSDAVTTNALLPTSTSKLTFSSPAIATFPTPDALLSVMMSVSPLTPICAPVTLTDSTSTYEAVLEISTYPFVLVMDRPPPVDPECVSAADCLDNVTSSLALIPPATATFPTEAALVSVMMSSSPSIPIWTPVNLTSSTPTYPLVLFIVKPLSTAGAATCVIPAAVFVIVISADMSYPPDAVNVPLMVTARSNVASSLNTAVESTCKLVSTSTVPLERNRTCCVAAPAPLVVDLVPKTKSPLVSPASSVCS